MVKQEDKYTSFIEDCENNGFPVIAGAKFIYRFNNTFMYNDDSQYTAEELYDIVDKENIDAEYYNLQMEIDTARECYLDMHGHI